MASILSGVVTSTTAGSPDIIFDSSSFGYKPRRVTVFCVNTTSNPSNGPVGIRVYPMHNDTAESSADNYLLIEIGSDVLFDHDYGPYAGGNITQIRAVAAGPGGRSEYILGVEK
jgi:hypothetical protein